MPPALAADPAGEPGVAVVRHSSGGLIARHALTADPRVRAWGLIDTEQPWGRGGASSSSFWRRTTGLSQGLEKQEDPERA